MSGGALASPGLGSCGVVEPSRHCGVTLWLDTPGTRARDTYVFIWPKTSLVWGSEGKGILSDSCWRPCVSTSMARGACAATRRLRNVLTHYPGAPHRALCGGTCKAGAPRRGGPHPGVCGPAWSSPGKRPSAGIQNEQSRMLLNIPRCVVWDHPRGRHRCLPDVARARAERPRVHQ